MEIVLNNQIYREENYRINEVEEVIQEMILYEEDDVADKNYSDTERECIASLN